MPARKAKTGTNIAEHLVLTTEHMVISTEHMVTEIDLRTSAGEFTPAGMCDSKQARTVHLRIQESLFGVLQANVEPKLPEREGIEWLVGFSNRNVRLT